MNIFKKIKLFNFMGSPVNLDPFFLILFLFFGPIEVLSIFISILVHEMAHSYVANKRGYHCNAINVGLFFGTAEVDINNIHERDSIPISFAGPLSNLLLFIIGSTIYAICLESSNNFFQFTGSFFEAQLIYFLIINLMLFVFNLIPIYPMDGGRILRDTFYLVLKNRRKSVRLSAWVSLTLSVIIFTFSLVNSYFILAFFVGLFGYQALKDLEFVK